MIPEYRKYIKTSIYLCFLSIYLPLSFYVYTWFISDLALRGSSQARRADDTRIQNIWYQDTARFQNIYLIYIHLSFLSICLPLSFYLYTWLISDLALRGSSQARKADDTRMQTRMMLLQIGCAWIFQHITRTLKINRFLMTFKSQIISLNMYSGNLPYCLNLILIFSFQKLKFKACFQIYVCV